MAASHTSVSYACRHDVLISTAYVTSAGLVLKQTRGVGADYSPNACNMYFMKYEYVAVRRMCRLATSTGQRKALGREGLHHAAMIALA